MFSLNEFLHCVIHFLILGHLVKSSLKVSNNHSHLFYLINYLAFNYLQHFLMKEEDMYYKFREGTYYPKQVLIKKSLFF